MNILILEDADVRIDAFLRDVSVGNNLTIVKTVEGAKDALTKVTTFCRHCGAHYPHRVGEGTCDRCDPASARAQYDLLCLDHDLGEQIYCASSAEDTGAAFVRWLVDTYPRPFAKVIIHSYNPGGAEYMNGLLLRYGWTSTKQPFGPSLFNLIKLAQSVPDPKSKEPWTDEGRPA